MGIFGHWKAWGGSTLAVGQLRRATDFTVPLFRAEAQDLYQRLGAALAESNFEALRKLSTPTQYAQLVKSLESRSPSEVHTYEASDVVAHIRQVRLGHAASAPELKFAQVTAAFQRGGRRVDAAGDPGGSAPTTRRDIKHGCGFRILYDRDAGARLAAQSTLGPQQSEEKS